MAIELDPDTRKRAIASMRRYFDENMDEPIGDLKAALLLDYVLAEIAPSVYNRAIRDVQAFVEDKLADLDGVLQLEFGHWKDGR
jgi:uncharacterized protein (DUF2164 family)